MPELLPSAKAPKLDPEHLLERAEGLTRKEFKRRYFNEDKPVALGNVGASWPALRKWRDLRWLKREHGHRNIPLEIGAYDDAANWREEVMPIARFVDEYLAPGLERELAESEAEAKAGAEAEVAGTPLRRRLKTSLTWRSTNCSSSSRRSCPTSTLPTCAAPRGACSG